MSPMFENPKVGDSVYVQCIPLSSTIQKITEVGEGWVAVTPHNIKYLMSTGFEKDPGPNYSPLQAQAKPTTNLRAQTAHMEVKHQDNIKLIRSCKWHDAPYGVVEAVARALETGNWGALDLACVVQATIEKKP